MKSISEKTGVPEEHIKTLMNAGFISCTFASWDEIYYEYKQARPACKSDTEAFKVVASKRNISYQWVYKVVNTLKK